MESPPSICLADAGPIHILRGDYAQGKVAERIADDRAKLVGAVEIQDEAAKSRAVFAAAIL